MVILAHATRLEGSPPILISSSSTHLVAEARAGVLVPHSELVIHPRVEVPPHVRVPAGTCFIGIDRYQQAPHGRVVNQPAVPRLLLY